MKVRLLKGFFGLGFGCNRIRIQDRNHDGWYWVYHVKIYLGPFVIAGDLNSKPISTRHGGLENG